MTWDSIRSIESYALYHAYGISLMHRPYKVVDIKWRQRHVINQVVIIQSTKMVLF